jgi:hypothetical protein
MRPQLVNGGRVLVYLNGRRFGRAISLEMSSESPVRAIETIDDPQPAELAPTRVRVKGQIKCYRLAGDGGLEGMGITTQFADIPRQKYFQLTLRDRITDNVILEFDYCMVEAQHWTVAAKEFMMGSFNFTGITWANEVSTGGVQQNRGLP